MQLLYVALALLASSAAAFAGEALPDGLYAEFITSRGTITAELFYQKTPLTVASFVGLAEGTLGPKKGLPFFNGLRFHRVVPNFVVQGGDPLGTGEGGPGYAFSDEFVPGLRHDAVGILSMANDGPDTNGSQFFFTLHEVNRLNYLHSVFGRVIAGVEILQQIKANDVIIAVNIRRVGSAAHAFRTDQSTFDTLAAQTSKARPIKPAGAAANFEDPDRILPVDPPRALAFQRKLANFERATGRKIFARLYAKFTPASPNQRPGSLAGSMAQKLNLPQDSVFAAYFADIDSWGLWVGDAYVPQFVGRSGLVSEFVRDGSLHQAKQALLRSAKTQAELAAAAFVQSTPLDKPLTVAQRVKFRVDAVLDALIFKIEPKP